MDKTDAMARVGTKAANTAGEALRKAYLYAQGGDTGEALKHLRQATHSFTRAGLALTQADRLCQAESALIKARDCDKGGRHYRRILTTASGA